MIEKEDKTNLELRSKVLEHALYIENTVNGLLLGHLAIFDKERTKNFGNKAGISFKSKIDLLFDINVLSKEEHAQLELQMIFRNKFVHDLDCNTFDYALKNFDNGISNRLKKYLQSETKIENEEEYERAYLYLYLDNAKMLLAKYDQRKNLLEEKREFILSLINSHELLIDATFKFLERNFEIAEVAKIKNPEILALTIITENSKNFIKEISDAHHMSELFKKFDPIPDYLVASLFK